MGLILFVIVYLAPFYVALYRGHPHLWTLFLLNLSTGWTLIGWIAALAWAVIQPCPSDTT